MPVLIASCGQDAQPADIPNPRLCSLAWRTVFSPPQNFLPPIGSGALQLHGEQLFVNNLGAGLPDQPAILALPVGGGDARTVHEGPVWSFWFEDDNLLFNEGAVLFSMPAGGGSQQAVLTYHSLDDRTAAFVQSWALDREAVYLVPGGLAPATISVWRAARDGSGEQSVGTLPTDPTAFTFVRQLLPVADHLVIETNKSVYTVPKIGTDVVEIAAPAMTRTQPLALGADGTSLWFREHGDYGHPTVDVVEVTPDGASQTTLWTTNLFSAFSSKAWSDGNGGWYVTTSERATDTGFHTTIWSVHAGAAAARLACDPEIGRIVNIGIGTPTAAYLVAVAADYQSWQLVAVDEHP